MHGYCGFCFGASAITQSVKLALNKKLDANRAQAQAQTGAWLDRQRIVDAARARSR